MDRQLIEPRTTTASVKETAQSENHPELYRLSPVVAVEDFGARALALHCEELRMVELNATARDLLRRLDGRASLRQVAEAMAQEYGQPFETVLADVQASVAQMVALGIVEPMTPE